MSLPTDRSPSDVDPLLHPGDHNTLHQLYNELYSLVALSEVAVASGDVLLFEDISNGDIKVRTTAQAIADLGVGGADGTAIHINAAGEISVMTLVAAAAGDHAVIEDLSDGNNKKRVTLASIAALFDDSGSLHGATASELLALTARSTLAANDVYMLEQASDGAKFGVTLTQLGAAINTLVPHSHDPSGGGDDTTNPVITLLGNDPQTIVVLGSYIEAGATALDDVDGDLTASIIIDASTVDPDTIGTYTVYYSVKDAAGNSGATTRTVNVIDAGAGAWGDGILYGDRPSQGAQIYHNGANNVIIENLDFRGSQFQYAFDGTNGHVCILLEGCTNITIRNCDFTSLSQPIAIIGGGATILIEYCRVNGITGPSERYDVQTGNFVQTVGAPTDVTVAYNKIIGGDTEDIISSFSAIDMWIHHNEIDGTGWTSDSGTGIIVADGGGSGCIVEDNTLLNPGQVGIAIAGGINGIVRRNIVYSSHVAENVGMYHINYYPAEPYGNNEFRDNRVWFSNSNGVYFPDPVPTIDVNNNWDDATIDPADLVVVL